MSHQQAIAVYSWGKYKDREGGWTRYERKIEPGKITVASEKDLSITFTLSDDGEKLEGEYKRPSKSQINYVTMQQQPPTSTVTFSTEGSPTPLPANVKIAPPQPDLPKHITIFSGAWRGTWDNGRLTTLIVERIEAKVVYGVMMGIEAIVVYSWGPLKKESGGWRRYIGEIEPGKLKLSNPETDLTINYLLSKEGETLDATWQKEGGKKLKATMRRQ